MKTRSSTRATARQGLPPAAAPQQQETPALPRRVGEKKKTPARRGAPKEQEQPAITQADMAALQDPQRQFTPIRREPEVINDGKGLRVLIDPTLERKPFDPPKFPEVNAMWGRWFSHYNEKVKGGQVERHAAEEVAMHFSEESIAPNRDGGLFAAWMKAYVEHCPIVVSVDDLALLLALHYAKYVSDHPEELRDLYVEHKGKKVLEVQIDGYESQMERHYPVFFEKMEKEIQKNVVKSPACNQSVAEVLGTRFSTTTPLFHRLQTAAVMDSLQHYFVYRAQMGGCGFPEVQFLGTLEDFSKLHQNIALLQEHFVKHDNFRQVLSNFAWVVGKFIETMKGEVDLAWWNSVMRIERQNEVIYGAPQDENITGWILYLFGKKPTPTPSSSLTTHKIAVPVEWHDLNTRLMYTVGVVGGFYGYHEDPTTRAVRPSTSMAVFKDLASIKKLAPESADKHESTF